MIKKFVIVATALIIFSASMVLSEGAKWISVKNAKKLKSIKAKNITWKKDNAKMVRISEELNQKIKEATHNQPDNPVSPKKETRIKVSEPFYMDAYETTIGQFRKFLQSSNYKPMKPIKWDEVYMYSPTDKHPMIYVSWHDASAYAKWAGKRLPTNKEWEFATRGGLIDKEFPWGNNKNLAREYANYEGTGGKDNWDNSTAPVGSLKPNNYGLFDMSGNVSEWCHNQSNKNHSTYVLRGGSWCNFTDPLRVAYQLYPDPHHRSYIVGFRCVIRLESP